ncbi:Ribonuclease H-like superfamily [Sesbania bispinosa]|nr:Ribonuclease H-like superfamily [Sesbania bispinosa]
MEPPKSLKDMQQFMGKIGYIRRFMPALSELIEPMRELLKGKSVFAWGPIHQEAFEKIKVVVASTQVMSPPAPSKPLRLYLAITKQTINGLITQDVDGEEKPVAYLSRVMKDAESRYSTQEKHCLGLVYAEQKYRHYFQGHTVHVMSKSEGIRYMLNNAFVTGRVSRWALLLGEYDNKIVYPQKLNCQALVDMMAICAGRHEEEVSEDIRGEVLEANVSEAREEEWWCIKFHGAKRLLIQGDSNLVVKQIKGEYGVKEASLALYRDRALSLLSLFEQVQVCHIPRTENKHADALATIGSKEEGETGRTVVTFKRLEKPALSTFKQEGAVPDWRNPVFLQLSQKFTSKTAHEYQNLRGILYKKSAEGLLMKCITEEEGKKKIKDLHQAVCG